MDERPQRLTGPVKLVVVARISAVGGSVRLFRPEEFGGAPGEGVDDTVVNFNIRLFAELDDHRRVIDQGPQSFGLGMSTQQAITVASIRDAILDMLSVSPELPKEHRAGQWGRLVEQLRDEGIGVDPETLHVLPFRLEVDYDVIERFGAT